MSVASTIYDDAMEYDHLGIGPSGGSAEADFYASLSPSGGLVLELACGSGRLTVPLAERGLALTGLDNSSSMLAAAEAKAAQRGVTPNFVPGDMRDFSFDTQFDLIFLPNNSLGHLHTLADICACFKSVVRHLAPSGRFALDMFNPSLPLLMRDPKQVSPVAEFVRADGKTVVVTETVSYDAATQISRGLWRYRVDGEPDVVRPLDLRLFFPQELDALLTLNELTIEAKYGGFDRSPFVSSSRRQLVVCRL